MSYDLDGHLIAEADGATGATLREYIWLAANDNEPVDLPLALVTSVNTASPVLSMVHADHLGRPIRMSDASRATVWQASYAPFGEPQSISGTIEQNLRFPGQYFLIETNLAYNWHRHYDPTTGRYTQPDPLRFVDGPSVYAYVGASPLITVDATGLMGRGLKSFPCGRCTITPDSDQWKGAHTHWKCPGQKRGCIKKDGTLCDGSDFPPPNVLQCLKDRNRVPQDCTAPGTEPPPLPILPIIPLPGPGGGGGGVKCRPGSIDLMCQDLLLN